MKCFYSSKIKKIKRRILKGISKKALINMADQEDEELNESQTNLLVSADHEQNTAAAPSVYIPVVHHWFYCRTIGAKSTWIPFSYYDSNRLETSFLEANTNVIAVEAGRFDVNLSERKRTPVYWQDEPDEVRRCSWFYKSISSRYVPYDEQAAEMLEREYKEAVENGSWKKKIILSFSEQVVFHAGGMIVHMMPQPTNDNTPSTSQLTARPRIVKRDLDDFIIEQGTPLQTDHLLFMVHGMGATCDLQMHSIEQVVDDFRVMAGQLTQTHFKSAVERGEAGCVEVLPISWHNHLRTTDVSIDDKLKLITLESIPKLRSFANDTILDVLFYTSPTYCQRIMNIVTRTMNDSYKLFCARNPSFKGRVSLAGHSLGAVILFDLLCHQKADKQSSTAPPQPFDNAVEIKPSYIMGTAGTGQPFIHYEQLSFEPQIFFAMGSPIGMFVTIRGTEDLGLNFQLPTCAGFFNIFHPYDPIAYRMEALINPDMSNIRPELISHHKGRKRMHLELKETMTRVGADLKQRFFDTYQSAMGRVSNLSTGQRQEVEENMEKEVNKVLEMELERQQQQTETDLSAELKMNLGKLNAFKRIDYVLQEAPFEIFNEYLFALSSHVCYWYSEDTILFLLKQIYLGLGITADCPAAQSNEKQEQSPSENNSPVQQSQTN